MNVAEVNNKFKKRKIIVFHHLQRTEGTLEALHVRHKLVNHLLSEVVDIIPDGLCQ